MGLFDMAFKNIKRNFYNYFLYFVSMIFSIMIYFTFTSIQYNTQVQKTVGASVNFSAVFKASAVVIAIFVAVFIWYSNSFFIRKRKKEIALYSLLGIKKREIGTMLFYENIVMGIAALGAGILLGSLLSKLFIMLLIRLMGFSADIIFMIPVKAVVNTAVVFTVLFLIASIHGYSLIYRFKLIELFKAETQGEKAPKASVFLSVLSVLLIVTGYWLYTRPITGYFIFIIFITLGLTVVGTFMFFSSLTLLIIKLSKKNRKRYYSGINMIGTSQLLYRIKASARTLAVIAVLSAAALTATEVSSSFYYKLAVNLQENYGFTYAYASNDRAIDEKIEAIIAKHPENKLVTSMDMNFLKVKGKWPSFTNTVDFYIISESSYNQIANIRGLKDRIKLNNSSDTAIFGEALSFTNQYGYIGKSITINGNGNNGSETLKVVDFKNYALSNTGMMRWSVVVKDDVYNKYLADGKIYRVKGYITENKKNSQELTNELTILMDEQLTHDDNDFPRYSFYYTEYRGGLTYSGLVIFIGAFLGLLFLIATGSIIFFKQLSEANDDKGRYEILRKIGVTKKEIKASISKQILIVFILPLIMGIMHSLVASTLLSTMLTVKLTIPIIITVSAYTVIYMIYYFLTVKAYYGIIE